MKHMSNIIASSLKSEGVTPQNLSVSLMSPVKKYTRTLSLLGPSPVSHCLGAYLSRWSEVKTSQFIYDRGDLSETFYHYTTAKSVSLSLLTSDQA